MSRPFDLPDMTTRAHGTRSRYVAGCRCDKCRSANTVFARKRAKEAKLRVQLLSPNPTRFELCPQEWTAPDGAKAIRFYKRACPGLDNEPCVSKSHLRSDSVGGVCSKCREKLVWNGIVSSDAARKHILKLAHAGVGSRSISAASDVGRSLIQKLKRGDAPRIRAEVERRILAVTPEKARGAGNLVNAKPTWSRINRLMDEGFTKREIARRMGYRSPAIPLNPKRKLITAASAMRYERFYNRIMAI